jgi:hypothetical protein
MAVKVLGQVNPTAVTLTTLYTVPAGKATVVSTLSVCNISTSVITYRVAIRPAGATIASQHYLVYGVSLPANSSDFYTIGISLAATDVVSVYVSDTNAAFSLFGDES